MQETQALRYKLANALQCASPDAFSCFLNGSALPPSQLNGANPVLTLFRSMVLLLALPFLTVTATADLSPSPRPAVTSVSSKLIFSGSTLTGPAKLGIAHIKRTTAELEDGPEGEQDPIANLVRGYDGDDQVELSFSFVRVAFSILSFVPDFARAAPAKSFSVCAGFPTGPPSA